MALDNMQQVREANRAAGSHWFDPETLRWFGGRVGDTLYPAGERRLFISSEQDSGGAWNRRRRWSVREALPGGEIETVGEFGEYGSWDAARDAIRRLAAEARK